MHALGRVGAGNVASLLERRGAGLLTVSILQVAWGSCGAAYSRSLQVRGLSPRTDRPGAVLLLALSRLLSFFFLLVSPHGRGDEQSARGWFLVAENVYLWCALSTLGSAVLADTRGLHVTLAACWLGVLGSALSGARLGWLLTPAALGLLWAGGQARDWLRRVPECADEGGTPGQEDLRRAGQVRFGRCVLAVAGLALMYACAALLPADYDLAVSVAAALGAAGLLQQVWSQPDLWVRAGGGRVPGAHVYYIREEEEEAGGDDDAPPGKAGGGPAVAPRPDGNPDGDDNHGPRAVVPAAAEAPPGALGGARS
eukprot:g37650.t1